MTPSFLDQLDQFAKIINWQVLILILSFLFRKGLIGMFDALKKKMETASEINIGKDGISIKQMKEALEKSQTETLGIMALGVGKKDREEQTTKLEKDNVNDPLKGSWLGKLEDRGKRISAEVEEIQGTALYRLQIRVFSTQENEPLKGKVRFHLHPSYSNPNPAINAENGVALLKLVSYGSFTLGAETEDGAKLKLDLAEDVPGVSEHFKNN